MLWFLIEVSLFEAAAARAQPCLLVMQPPKLEDGTARPAARKRRCFVRSEALLLAGVHMAS